MLLSIIYSSCLYVISHLCAVGAIKKKFWAGRKSVYVSYAACEVNAYLKLRAFQCRLCSQTNATTFAEEESNNIPKLHTREMNTDARARTSTEGVEGMLSGRRLCICTYHHKQKSGEIPNPCPPYFPANAHDYILQPLVDILTPTYSQLISSHFHQAWVFSPAIPARLCGCWQQSSLR
jgi:hypothetical protein